jgi:hypothetical protein
MHGKCPLLELAVLHVRVNLLLRLFALTRSQPSSRPTHEAAGPDYGDLPRRPDAGFVGRDETLLALDRAFDSAKVVLLHAYAGSGNTATAAEFARWYMQTGGSEGPVLFTCFETKHTLGQIIDQLGRCLEPLPKDEGIQWAAIIDAEERRRQALRILSRADLFWIWDNLEPDAGFPAGSQSAWSPQEQAELADFLRDASEGGAKFLLTSRRDESEWLGMIPTRVGIRLLLIVIPCPGFAAAVPGRHCNRAFRPARPS